MPLSRRVFIKQTMLLSNMFLLGCSKKKTPVQPVYDGSEKIFTESFQTKLILLPTDTIVFMGDSITDSRRDRNILLPNIAAGLGTGYVGEIAERLLSTAEYKNVSVYNRGVGANKTADLAARWDKDCLELQPDVISILIGINDLRTNISPSDYYKTYNKILSKTSSALPKAKLLICEPFLLPNIVNYRGLEKTFHEYRKIVRILSRDFKAVFIPYYQRFVDASKNDPPANWLVDGVHPNVSGTTLLSSVWGECLP